MKGSRFTSYLCLLSLLLITESYIFTFFCNLLVAFIFIIIGVPLSLLILLTASYTTYIEKRPKFGDPTPIGVTLSIAYGFLICFCIIIINIFIAPYISSNLNILSIITVDLYWISSGVVAIIGGLFYDEQKEIHLKKKSKKIKYYIIRKIKKNFYLVLFMFNKYFDPGFTVEEYRKQHKKNDYEARRDIKRMLKEGIIMEIGKIGNAKLYKITDHIKTKKKKVKKSN